jgi:D-3-phosphoglycerate dehydrogenase
MNVLVHTSSGGVPLADIASHADVVTLHVPATPQTERLVDEAFLSAMKPTAYLINCARGAVVDQEALVRALNDRTIAGAGLDVVVPETLPPNHPLLKCDNVVLTPHTAFYSEESIADLARLAAQAVADVLAGRTPESVVNPEVLTGSRERHEVASKPDDRSAR